MFQSQSIILKVHLHMCDKVYSGYFKDKHAIPVTFLNILRIHLRMVPTFVSAHKFCISRKAWFTAMHALGLALT